MERRLRRRKTILRYCLLILISFSSYLFIFKTNIFNIEDIEVIGINSMDPRQIVEAIPCAVGENIFKIDKEACEETLNALPYVRSSRVRRSLPNRIVIEIDERREVATIPYIGAFIYIDEEGYVLSIEERDDNVELPQIHGVELRGVKVRDNVFEILDLNNMTEFILLGEKAGLLSSIRYIDCGDKNNIIIGLKDGIKVAFGPLHNVKYKYSFLHHILEDIENEDRDVKQILFNKGDNPVVITGNQQGELHEKDE